MKIPLLDLKAQYQIIKEEIKEAVEDVFESQQFILGPKVETLEKAVANYCGCKYAIGVSSGTDALLIALMAADIGPGHGVITSPYTFFATAGSIVRAGARPLFADIDPVTYNVDPESILKLIEAECRFEPESEQLVHRQTTSTVRAIMPVHLYGQCADMDPILELANDYHLLVIEDDAQAMGAEYPSGDKDKSVRAGSIGEFGCFSFFPTKNLGGFGDGGMVTASDKDLAEKLRVLRVHGSKPKYHHQLVGGNFRLDALQAAVLLVKLKYLDTWTAKRRQNAAYYNSLFQQAGLVEKGSVIPPRAVWEEKLQELTANSHFASRSTITADRERENSKNPHISHLTSQTFPHIYNQYVIRAERRDELRAYLLEQGIGTEIYYPLPLHLQECFTNLGYHQDDFPESKRAAAETIALPIFPELERTQLTYVVEKITSFYANKQ